MVVQSCNASTLDTMSECQKPELHRGALSGKNVFWMFLSIQENLADEVSSLLLINIYVWNKFAKGQIANSFCWLLPVSSCLTQCHMPI